MVSWRCVGDPDGRGVGCTAAEFLDTLSEAGFSLLLDLRQRRGVRGADDSWADFRRLLGASLPAGAVERDPEVCHRSLVAERLPLLHGLPVRHLRPGLS